MSGVYKHSEKPSDESHDHTHHHGAGHSHAPASFGRAFMVGVGLNAGFVVIEVIYGLTSHSLALVADAGHNLSDVFGLLLAWGAAAWSQRLPTERHSYGLRRTSILAALANAIFLLVSVGIIAWEAVRRLYQPAFLTPQVMIWVSLLGIAINAGTAAMFMAGRKGDLNIRAAFQHMAADAVISAGVAIAGLAILFTGWMWLDPVVSLLLVAVVVWGTWSLLRDSLNLALDAVPPGIDAGAVRQYLESIPGVADPHHLHIWALGTTEVALTSHLVLSAGVSSNALLHEIQHNLLQRFGISHPTIQFESLGGPECEDRECRPSAGDHAPHVQDSLL